MRNQSDPNRTTFAYTGTGRPRTSLIGFSVAPRLEAFLRSDHL